MDGRHFVCVSTASDEDNNKAHPQFLPTEYQRRNLKKISMNSTRIAKHLAENLSDVRGGGNPGESHSIEDSEPDSW